jgi:hypothetical protein
MWALRTGSKKSAIKQLLDLVLEFLVLGGAHPIRWEVW